MKILFITVNLKESGGIQKYNIDFLKALKNENTSTVQFKKRDLTSKIIFSLSVFSRFFIFRPDVIVCGHINFAPFGYLIKKLFNKEYAIMTYGIDVWDINEKKARYLKNAAVVSSISVYTKDKIIAAVPELKEKIFMLPNAIDGEKFKPKQKSMALAEKLGVVGDKVILTVCRLVKSEGYKGYDKIIMALPGVIEDIKNVKYVLVGDGDDFGRTKRLVEEVKMENYVIMPGYVSKEELVDYYNLCDVFVMPSKGEGFGFVFLEALACGKPVIAGNIDGSVDAVLGGKVGILVDPDNAEEIKSAIIKILKKEAPMELLDGDYLRKKVLEVYGLDRFKQKTENLLYELQG